jgi:hypothetical protein
MPQASSSLVARFAELEMQFKSIRLNRQGDDSSADPVQFYAWSGSALTAIEAAFGESSSHAKRFKVEIESVYNNSVWSTKLQSILGIFLGAKSDLDGGHIYNLQKSLTGELFGDVVALGKQALVDGHHTVAAVLGCAALEDALKRYAAANGLDVTSKSMEDVVNALKSAGLVSGAQKGLLGAMPRIRNHAFHAEWDKISPQDAGSVLGFVEQFLLANF